MIFTYDEYLDARESTWCDAELTGQVKINREDRWVIESENARAIIQKMTRPRVTA